MTRRSSILGAILDLFGSARKPAARPSKAVRVAPGAAVHGDGPGRSGTTATIEVIPPAPGGLRISYAPEHDGNADAGEIVWTWVPYVERDGRGKDRPVLVIARESAERVYAVKLTSRSHDGDRDFLAIGAGPWDAQGRESWVDVDQVYSVHVAGLRREAAALDLDRFTRVAALLHQRYGWEIAG
ncbi:mRNA-degrading endonuclease toxin of MazEF toxin-antitoxin module [Microbacterium terrae]|uniref:PemK-like protein n=1 Tax=Microbacterium terrae TaxID=69369 RepID=A0A0M2GW39_9MICO|nr:type II toxin-antitoxin system PemK/MazF family toxin [Microbacterium terrae]KJL37939.1 PemK-like protein [Microbacterium terrae]MBP1077348.1 mRNA-degrading endonuclease toxin of MazEF toxin-antitoxin module [Microbacterium terrae]GLJ98959.1 mRNA interferase PemK [Microbacterium terrae]